MKADNVDEETLVTQHHKAKQREKLVKGYLTQMETQDQTEENNEKKKDNIQIFPYIMASIPWGVEATWCLLSPKNSTNSSLIKKIAVCSFYCKPGSRKKTLLLDHIAQTFHLLSAKFRDGLYFLICGDKNEMGIQQILNLSPDLKQTVENATRLNPDQVLDVIITDLHKYYQSPVIKDPLEPDPDKAGAASDHLTVVMSPIGSLNDRKTRIKKKIEFCPLNDQGFNEMGNKLSSFDWGQVLSLKSADSQMEAFQNNLFSLFSESFPMKTKIVFNESQEFFTDKLVMLKRKKKSEFKKHRRSDKFLSLHQTYKLS